MTSQTATIDQFDNLWQWLDHDRKTSAKYCDIILIVGEHKYPAHTCIFGLLSPVFDKMFNIEINKEQCDVVAVIEGVTKKEFESLLDLIYTDRITMDVSYM